MPAMSYRAGAVLWLVFALVASVPGCSHAPAAPAAPARAPGPDGISVVRAPSGVHVVVNHHPVHMTLELDGAEIGVSEDDPAVWLVDGQIIQVAVVPQQAIYGAAAAVHVSDEQLLHDHLAWESDYVASELGTSVRARQHACRTARGTRCLVSDYDIAQARRNLLITTVVNDQVVALASSVPVSLDPAEAEARLRAVLETIMPHDGWIDPAAEAARLHLGP
jgi:hypothetical protein